MANIFKIKKYSVITFCMMLLSLTAASQNCPPILGTIKAVPQVCPATVMATPASQTISSGQTTSIVLAANAVGTTFSWKTLQNGVIGATNGTGDIIAQVLTNTENKAGTVTYIITPKLGNCLGTSINVTITVGLY